MALKADWRIKEPSAQTKKNDAMDVGSVERMLQPRRVRISPSRSSNHDGGSSTDCNWDEVACALVMTGEQGVDHCCFCSQEVFFMV